MKYSIIAISALFCVSCTSQKNVSPGKPDSTQIASQDQNETKSATPTKTVILNNPPDKTNTASEKPAEEKKELNDKTDLPSCLNKLIAQFREEEVQNPPRKIYSYSYKGKTVYYVTPPCCDFFSDLYDKNCNIIAHPDGGITGRGDGRASDFDKVRTNERLLWEDKRKNR